MTAENTESLAEQDYRSTLRMNAYYWVFDFTNVESVDRILSAVATAGKAYHSTESWDERPWGDETGPTYWERIQIAANDAASALSDPAVIAQLPGAKPLIDVWRAVADLVVSITRDEWDDATNKVCHAYDLAAKRLPPAVRDVIEGSET